MFSLCIPTLNRYDKFLSQNLPKYIENELIEEIIISDENGNDINKIKSSNLNLEKVKMFKNDKVLGPFLNKLGACRKAKNEWIVLMDSDNFADKDYFQIAKKYLEENKPNQFSILAPSWAQPNFNYTEFENKIYKRNDLKNFRRTGNFLCSMNTGNYIINKYLVENINLEKETQNIEKSPSCDVIYFNTLLYEQLPLEMHIVKNMHYQHVVHDGSIYTQTNQRFRKFNQQIHQRFKRLSFLK